MYRSSILSYWTPMIVRWWRWVVTQFLPNFQFSEERNVPRTRFQYVEMIRFHFWIGTRSILMSKHVVLWNSASFVCLVNIIKFHLKARLFSIKMDVFMTKSHQSEIYTSTDRNVYSLQQPINFRSMFATLRRYQANEKGISKLKSHVLFGSRIAHFIRLAYLDHEKANLMLQIWIYSPLQRWLPSVLFACARMTIVAPTKASEPDPGKKHEKKNRLTWDAICCNDDKWTVSVHNCVLSS